MYICRAFCNIEYMYYVYNFHIVSYLMEGDGAVGTINVNFGF